MGKSDTKFPIVTICGSMRFYPTMLIAAEVWTAKGYIVLMPFVTKGADTDAETLDKMHRAKIDMADVVLFITGDENYMGPSTRSEWQYATKQQKTIA
jgi:hypothetical protein